MKVPTEKVSRIKIETSNLNCKNRNPVFLSRV